MKPSAPLRIMSATLPCVLFAAALSAAADGVLDDPEFKRAVAAYTEDRLDESELAFEKLARRFPNDRRILNNLAVIAARQNDIERAVKLLKRAIATDAAINTGYQNLSAIYAHLASLSYRDALSLESEDPQPLQLSLIGKNTDTTTAAPDAAAQAAQAEEVNQPLVRDPDAPAPPAQAGDVVSAIKQWAQTWSRQNVDAYFTSYINGYAPPQNSHRDWKRQRAERLTAPRHIEVKLSDIRIHMDGEDQARATFRQGYRSNLLSSSVIKQLHLKKIGNEWKITLERVV